MLKSLQFGTKLCPQLATVHMHSIKGSTPNLLRKIPEPSWKGEMLPFMRTCEFKFENFSLSPHVGDWIRKRRHQGHRKDFSLVMGPTDMHGSPWTVHNYLLLYVIMISQFSPAGRLSSEHNPALSDQAIQQGGCTKFLCGYERSNRKEKETS